MCLILIATSVMAQVKMYYPKYLAGKISQEDVSKISVTSLVPVVIEFIYKAKVIDERNNVVIMLESEVVYCKRGVTDYAKEEIKGLRVLKKEINLATYTGKLTFQSQIVHPLDTTSIIARVEKVLSLKNGISMTTDGRILTDPKLFRMDSEIPYAQKMVLEDLYDKLVFKNDNSGAHCIDLNFVITQNKKDIYKASMVELCLAPGESKLSEAQKGKVKIILNEYETRLPNRPIQVQIRHGENHVSNRKVEAVSHSEPGLDYIKYTNQSIGFSFDFFNQATNTFFPNAFNTIVIFDKNGKVEDIEQYPFERTESNPLGINGPDGCSRARSDINGRVIMQVLASNNFTDAQWLAYVAFVNGGIDEGELKIMESNGLEIIAPKKRSNTVISASSYRAFSTYTFAIKDKDKVILFEMAYVSKVPTATNYILPKAKIDVDKILNSIVYNKINFQFYFHKSGELKSLKLSSLEPKVDQQTSRLQYEKFLKYHWVMNKHVLKYGIKALDKNEEIIYLNLDAHIATYDVKEKIAIPKYKVITPYQDAIRKYETINWDSVQVSFSHRVDDTIFVPATSNRPKDYFYHAKEKIESWSSVSSSEPNTEKIQKYKNYIRISPLELQLHPVHGQNIGVSRIDNNVDETLLKSIVTYENSNKFSEAPSIKVIKTKGWKFYISTQLINQSQMRGNTNTVFIDSGQFLYRIYIAGGFKSDILHLLNSLKIEGKQLRFQYNTARQLESIEII